MDKEFDFFVGLDWARESHEVCACDAQGTIVQRRSVAHSGDGLRELVDWLARLSDDHLERVALAVEMPHGAVIDLLLERRVAVFSLNPKQMDRFRDRFSPAGAKDDRRDAYVIADSLRTDRRCFRRLVPEPALTVQLRELLRSEEEGNEELRRQANRLAELLHRYYPALLALCAAADEPWLWALLQRAPTPAQGRRLHRTTLERLLRQHRIRRFCADQLQTALQATPLPVAPGVVEAASEHVALLLPRLRLVQEQRKQVRRRVESVLEAMATASPDRDDLDPKGSEHRDVQILLSAPGVGRVTVATMLAQASRAIAARDYAAFRAQAGLAPVTKASGKSKRVHMRRACDARLRNALYHMARVASIRDPAAQAHYAELRQRGQSHGRALRAVADRLVRIQFAMLRDGTLYDSARCPRPASVPAKAA
jgi:transposase